MTTKVYGASDDLIEFEGDLSGEVNHFGTDEHEHGVLLAFSDGTLLDVKYGKPQGGIWAISVLRKGDLLIGVDVCIDEDADPYSDVATFGNGIKWCKEAATWSDVS
jgi:hypothetical protein